VRTPIFFPKQKERISENSDSPGSIARTPEGYGVILLDGKAYDAALKGQRLLTGETITEALLRARHSLEATG